MLIGRLGQDPIVMATNTGTSVCNISVATSKRWTDKEGQKQEKTEWHKVVVFGKQADNCEKFLNKGSQVYIEGELQTRQWEKEGVKQYTTEIVAQNVQFLDTKSSEDGRQNNPTNDIGF